MNIPELKAAAELLERWGHDVVASFSMMADYDTKAVAHAAGEVGRWLGTSILSDEDVTAAWLRETWGAKDIGDGTYDVAEIKTPHNDWIAQDALVLVSFRETPKTPGGPAVLCFFLGRWIRIDSQGQLTLLFLGLGLTPKGGGE